MRTHAGRLSLPPLHLAVEGPTVHAQPPRGGGQIATRRLDDAEDVAALHFGEREGSLVRHRGQRLAEQEVFRQILHVDRGPRREYHQPLDGIREFADVSGPRVALENPHLLRSHLLLPEPASLQQAKKVRTVTWDIVR